MITNCSILFIQYSTSMINCPTFSSFLLKIKSRHYFFNSQSTILKKKISIWIVSSFLYCTFFSSNTNLQCKLVGSWLLSKTVHCIPSIFMNQTGILFTLTQFLIFHPFLPVWLLLPLIGCTWKSFRFWFPNQSYSSMTTVSWAFSHHSFFPPLFFTFKIKMSTDYIFFVYLFQYK